MDDLSMVVHRSMLDLRRLLRQRGHESAADEDELFNAVRDDLVKRLRERESDDE